MLTVSPLSRASSLPQWIFGALQDRNMNQLPIIDIGPLYSDEQTAWQEVADQIVSACREWGFFYIKGHPITATRIGQLLDCAKQFFALPVVEKLKIDITQTRH